MLHCRSRRHDDHDRHDHHDRHDDDRSTTGTTTTAAPPAPDGSGSLTTPLAPVTAGSTGNTLTFTYTAATGGMANGELKLTVPIGWSAPSTNAADAGFTKSSTGTVSVEGSVHRRGRHHAFGGRHPDADLRRQERRRHRREGAAHPGDRRHGSRSSARRRSGTLTSIPAPSVVVGPAASGADSLIFGTPPVGSTTPPAVAVGGTLSITGNSLRLNALPGRADIEIAIDTTSSMGASIGQAKADATALVTQRAQGHPGRAVLGRPVPRQRRHPRVPGRAIADGKRRRRPGGNRRSSACRRKRFPGGLQPRLSQQLLTGARRRPRVAVRQRGSSSSSSAMRSRTARSRPRSRAAATSPRIRMGCPRQPSWPACAPTSGRSS